MLLTINDVLTPQELSQVQRLLSNAQWESGQASAGPQAAQVKNNRQLAESCPAIGPLRTLVLDALNRSPVFFSAALPLRVLPPLFNCYRAPGECYGFHVDGAMRLVPGARASYVRADLSATLFLSDPQTYDGGVLTIDDTFGRHGVKLEAGSLVLYPSSSVHAVTPVTSGERLACFLFLQSMVRDTGQRRLLFEMDQALQQLRSDHGEAPALVQLTGTYHNLLRQWASC